PPACAAAGVAGKWPSPRGEGEIFAAAEAGKALGLSVRGDELLPRPGVAGWGEGEGNRGMPPTVTSTSLSLASISLPRKSSAYTASAVALVVFQSWVCFCFSNQTLHSSTACRSPITSSNASIISACVSIGARYHHQLNSVSRQNMPISSFVTERSLIDFMMSDGVESVKALRALKRLSAMARWPCDWRLARPSQNLRVWPRKYSTASLCLASIPLSFRKKLRPYR